MTINARCLPTMLLLVTMPGFACKAVPLEILHALVSIIAMSKYNIITLTHVGGGYSIAICNSV